MPDEPFLLDHSAAENRVEMRHLRAFVAVAEELHYGRAARRLHVAQPALTKQIQQLELALDVRLFERSSRSVSLTESGAAFLDEARRTLEHNRRAIDAATRAARGELGVLRVGFSASGPNGVFPHVIRAFRRRHPEVRLELTEMWSTEQAEALALDGLDVGFANHPAIGSQLLESEVLQEDPLLVAINEHNPLATAERLSIRELRDEQFIAFPRSNAPDSFDQLIAACQRAGFSPRIVQETRAVNATLGLVAAGLGVALLPENIRTLQRAGVRYVDLVPPAPILRTAVVWRRGNASTVLSRFLDIARTTRPPDA